MISVYVPTFSNYDATCNDAISMCEILMKLGYEVNLISANFVESCEQVPSLDYSEGIDAIDNEESLFIYHYGTYDPHFEKIVSLKCKKVFRFHNITEPIFFNGYDSVAENMCKRGKEQIRNSLTGFDCYWSNSFFTAGELVHNCGLLPEDSNVLYPFHRIEQRLNGGRRVHRVMEEKPEVKLLNVGRICPHKNQLFLLKCFKELMAESDQSFQLTFVGKIGPQRYWEEFMDELSNSGLREHVHLFTNGISEEELQKQYRDADIFCCVSRHEGYCVPVVEAMSFSIPVISTSDTALKDTIASFGLLVENNNLHHLKHAIMRTSREKKIYNVLSKLSYQGYERMATPAIEKIFFRNLSTVIKEIEKPCV